MSNGPEGFPLTSIAEDADLSLLALDMNSDPIKTPIMPEELSDLKAVAEQTHMDLDSVMRSNRVQHPGFRGFIGK